MADLQRRLSVLEYNTGISHTAPQYVTPEPAALQATLSPASNPLAAVIDCDTPLAGSVSDDALVKIRKPIPPVMTSIDTNSIGRINPEQVYSQTEAAALLHLSISTIRKYVKEQRIGFSEDWQIHALSWSGSSELSCPVRMRDQRVFFSRK